MPADAEHEQLLDEAFKKYSNDSELLAYLLRPLATRDDRERVAEPLAKNPSSEGYDNRF